MSGLRDTRKTYLRVRVPGSSFQVLRAAAGVHRSRRMLRTRFVVTGPILAP